MQEAIKEFHTKDVHFDNRDRSKRLSQSVNTHYDLIIVGGGITGAGIACDAALRGLKTLLVEKLDFASGTSSKSTKLIHGGLRYLKQLEFGLVKETGLERAVAHHNIPHLVHPEKMLLPIVERGTFGKLSASFAISVYDRLARVPDEDRKVAFDKQQTLEQEPLLKPDLLKSSIQYSEYRTDDARLTIELVKASIRNGGEAYNYLEVSDFKYENGRVKGVICTDHISGDVLEFSAVQVVSAAGPWVDALRSINNSKRGKTLQLTKGVHIVLPKQRLPLKTSVYFDDFEGRMLFAIPRGNVTYVGTSDTQYSGDKDKVLCTKEDASYLLRAINVMFEVDQIIMSDIISSWAGLRPLIHEEGKSPSELSRKDEIFLSDSGLISIAGGKLTGFRKMAQRVVDLVLDQNEQFEQQRCTTKTYKIHSDSFENYASFQQFQSSLQVHVEGFEISNYDAWYLATTYGKNALGILELASKWSLSQEEAILASEIAFCIQHESCYFPDDYFNRRTGRLYFDIASVQKYAKVIIDEFAKHFDWDDTIKAALLIKCKEDIQTVSQFE